MFFAVYVMRLYLFIVFYTASGKHQRILGTAVTFRGKKKRKWGTAVAIEVLTLFV